MRRVSKYCQELGISEADKAKQLGEFLGVAYTRGLVFGQELNKRPDDPTFLVDVMSDLISWMGDDLE